MEIARSVVKDPIVKTLLPKEQPLDNITQIYVRCNSQADKYQAIQDIYELHCAMNTAGSRRIVALPFVFCNVM